MKNFCFDCSHFSEIEIMNEQCGECRRSPPVIVESLYLDNELSNFEFVANVSHWPIVAAADWCGEFKQADKSDDSLADADVYSLIVCPKCGAQPAQYPDCECGHLIG